MPLSGDGGDEMGSRGDTEGEGLLTRGTFHEGPDLDPRPGGVSGGRAGPQTPPPPSPLEPGGLLRAVPPKLQAGLGARWEAAGLTSAGAGQTGRGSRARGRVVPVPRPPPPRPPRPQEAGGRTAGSQASVSTDRRAEAAAGPQRMSTSWRQPGPQPPSAATLRSGPAETGRLRGLTEPHVGARGHGDSVPVCDTARRPRQLAAGSRQRGPGGRVPAARCGATAEPGRRPPPISVSRRVRSRPAAPVALSPCRLSPCPESLSLPARSPPPPPRSTRTARPTARRPEGSRKIALPGETP